MKINKQDYNDVTVVELHGEFEAEYCDMFEKNITEIIASKRKSIVLDMNDISFIDSKGLEQLLWARDFCNSSSGQIKLAGLDENCSKILEITRLSNELDIYAELAGAVKSFA